jgi:hypothetical protein
MNQPMNVTAKKLMCRHTNRGGRVWLEGRALDKHGYTNQAAYDVVYTATTIELTLNSTGARKVAGTIARPIIDLHSKLIATMFDDGSKVSITMLGGVITIEGVE